MPKSYHQSRPAIGRYESGPIPNIGNENAIKLLTYTLVPIDFDEWFFINETFDPSVTQSDNSAGIYTEEYWNNQFDGLTFVPNSGLGNQCVVEYISKSDLIRARGYKVD